MPVTKRPLLPVITIKKDDATLYTFNSFIPTFDFRVLSLRLKPVSDSKGGTFKLSIISADGTTSGTNTLLNNIGGNNEVTIWIGKTDATKTKIFLGIVESVQVDEPNKNLMTLTLTGPDFGSNILKNRIIDQDWVQKKTSDGITLDTTDNNVLVSQIVTDILTIKSSYYVENDITIADQGVIVTAGNITPNDIRIPQFSASMEYADDKIDELDVYGKSIHYVDPDKNFIMKQVPLFTSSTPTIMLSDNLTDAATVAWDQDKLGYIAPNSSMVYSLENYKKRIYGIGGDQLKLDVAKETTSSSTVLYDKYIVVKFTTVASNLDSIQIALSKTGSPSLDAVLELVEDASGAPGTSIIRVVSLNKNAVTGTAAMHNFTMNAELTANTAYWMILRDDGGDVSNTYNWHRDALDTGTHSTSTDGVTWTPAATPNRWNFAYRIYSRNPITPYKPGSGIVATDLLREEVVRDATITDYDTMAKSIAADLEIVSQVKEIFTCNVYAPNTLFAVGDKIRINKTASGKVIVGDFLCSNIEYIFDNSNDGAVGAIYFEAEFIRYSIF